MSTVRPHALVHRGTVVAHGVWISIRTLGEAEARARVLAQDAVGKAVVLEIANGYFVRWPGPRRVHVDVAPGVVLTLEGGVWSGLPLTRAEREAVGVQDGDLVLAIAGTLRRWSLREGVVCQPWRWLDLSGWTHAPPRVRPRARGSTLPPLVGADEPTDVWAILGEAVPKPDPRREAILDALRDDATPMQRTGVAKPGASGKGPFGRLFSWLGGGTSGSGNAKGQGAPGTAIAQREAKPPGAFSSWWRERAARSWLGSIVGRQQAQYLYKTLDLFERGRLDEALRHAIPFSALPGTPRPPSLGFLSPRASIELRPSGTVAATSINLGSDFYTRFREIYTKAAERLEAEGRIEEAAYVWFDLLGDHDRGIALLERHHRYALAAEMAMARELPPGLVIRLWFQAGRPDKAVIVARRTGAFKDAIDRLERTQLRAHANELRILWADRLAKAGHFPAAVDAIWPVEQARNLARAWVDLGLRQGGATRVAMVVRKAGAWGHEDGVVAELDAVVDEILVDRDLEASAWRELLAERLLKGELRGQPFTGWSRDLARALVLDGNSTGTALAERSDPVLHAELSRLRLAKRSPVVLPSRIEAIDVGLSDIRDAMLLPNGRCVIATGEAGVHVLRHDGRRLQSYEHPVDRFVGAYGEARALGLVQRGDRVEVHHFDWVTGAAERWCETAFERAAPRYDGSVWYVTEGDAVTAIDTQDPRFVALWRVGGLSGTVLALSHEPKAMSFMVTAGDVVEKFRYELSDAGTVLRSRTALPGAAEVIGGRVLGDVGGGDVLTSSFPEQGLHDIGIWTPRHVMQRRRPGIVLAVDYGPSLTLVLAHADRVEIERLDPSSLGVLARIELIGATRACFRRRGDPPGHVAAVVADDRGRLLGVDAQLRVVTSLRV